MRAHVMVPTPSSGKDDSLIAAIDPLKFYPAFSCSESSHLPVAITTITTTTTTTILFQHK